MWSLFSKQSSATSRLLRRTIPLRPFSMPTKHSVEEPSPDTLMDSQITCLMLHPVTWPNHGPHKELYLAEEGIGLVRSLDWEVAKGPLWKDQDKDQEKQKYVEDDDKSANDTQ
jgi:hypothetical protein